MQLAFYFDQTRCNGCYTCVVACKDWHDIPAGPASWMRVKTIELGKYPKPFLAYLQSTCFHCAEPACLAACPVNAISKRKQDGIVLVDTAVCLGKDSCHMCLDVCPYQAPQFGAETNAKMQKCNLCVERWAGNQKPICTDSCPARALDAGPLNEMIAKYGEATGATGFTYDTKLRPSVIFRPKLQL